MLEDSLFASRPSARSKKPATVAISVLVHGTLAAVLILIPLFQHQVLPQIPLFEPLRPPAAPRGAVELVAVPNARSGGPATAAPPPRALVAPTEIPRDIARFKDAPVSNFGGLLPSDGPGQGLRGFPGGSDFGIPFSTGDRVAALPPPPPPPPPVVESAAPKVEEARGPIPRGGDLVASNLIHTVNPVYPRLAVLARVQGKVILEAVITREGAIDSARMKVLRSDSTLLEPAAIEAVQQWRYRPTLLNGKPVEILTTITVNFTLK